MADVESFKCKLVSYDEITKWCSDVADKIRDIVKATAAELGIEGGKQNMGKLMGAVMGKVKGVADGNDVKKAVEQFLA